ncbi:hypothetical protein [uncultured Microbacterium sp.]|uniref:hypothetical protein n=1 Tax=uncultured Microbacterium sp. TaxID=191216 RepID=UPI0026362E15|nr:hypothetical protein [uncultured Microbacterium sp.]
MANITIHYGITGPVPFIDVDVAADNRLYVDPRAIRLRRSPQPFADEAVRCSDTFLTAITDCIFDGSSSALRRGEDLLCHFIEPWETRLGMAAEGFGGHGGAAVVGGWIWATLTGDVEALVRLGILHQLEDLPVFVDGVDKDITSDVATRIMFEPLARFTEQMLATYPEFTSDGHEVRTFRKQVWNPATYGWDEKDFTLPVVDGKELLLVPTGWARSTLLMSAGRYYETSVLSFVQMEQAVLGRNGKPLRTPKRLLKKRPDLVRGRRTSLEVTLRAIRNRDDLLAMFKRFVDERYDDGLGEAAA